VLVLDNRKCRRYSLTEVFISFFFVEYKVHAYNRNGLCAVGFMDDHYPVRSAFSLLNQVRVRMCIGSMLYLLFVVCYVLSNLVVSLLAVLLFSVAVIRLVSLYYLSADYYFSVT